jgi:hypothetical protein
MRLKLKKPQIRTETRESVRNAFYLATERQQILPADAIHSINTTIADFVRA